MTTDTLLVFLILGATLVLFAMDRLRLDVVALLALLALGLTGILSVPETLAGFADPIVIMIAGLFIVGDGLFQTGVATAMGRLPSRLAGDSQINLVAVLMLMVALMSGFISSTGTVAVMLPVAVGVARERSLSPSRLLIPLAAASLLGGTLTLIGTPPNIIVANHLREMGREPFGFFTFTPLGLLIVATGIAFMALVGRRLLPDRQAPEQQKSAATTTLAELTERYGLQAVLFRARIMAGSPLADRTLAASAPRTKYGITVVDIRDSTGTNAARPVVPETVLRVGDFLQIQGTPKQVAEFVGAQKLALVPDESDSESDNSHPLTTGDIGLVEVLLTPRSRLIGKSLSEIGFRERYRVTVLALSRFGELLSEDLREIPLSFGDSLLVKGPWENIKRLQTDRRDMVVTGIPIELEDAKRPFKRAPLAVAIMLAMMAMMSLNLLPAVHAVILAALAMVLSRCVNPAAAYRAINWESVVLIAAILPMATALEKTGGMDLVVGSLDSLLAGAGPLALLAVLFLLTSVLSQMISNTATTVLLAPIAFSLAETVGLNPEPFMMGIALAASTAFSTPIASPVNTLVLGPGGYRFKDFFKVGVPLQLIVLLVTLAAVPLLFPFH